MCKALGALESECRSTWNCAVFPVDWLVYLSVGGAWTFKLKFWWKEIFCLKTILCNPKMHSREQLQSFMKIFLKIRFIFIVYFIFSLCFALVRRKLIFESESKWPPMSSKLFSLYLIQIKLNCSRDLVMFRNCWGLEGCMQPF